MQLFFTNHGSLHILKSSSLIDSARAVLQHSMVGSQLLLASASSKLQSPGEPHMSRVEWIIYLKLIVRNLVNLLGSIH